MQKQQVIFVHGTFATSDDDEGDKWWQRGSQFWKAVSEKLCAEATPCGEGRLFRWSGENSERARRAAAIDLYSTVLLPLEEQGIGFHIVGHSHGGNVIRKALIIAAKSKRPLTKLRSWTTVGTPFLQIQSSYTLRSAIAVILGVTTLLVGVAFGLALWVGWMAGLSIESDLVEGVFVTVSVLSVPLYLFFVVGPVFSILNDRFVRFEAEARVHHEINWLGLWSTRDEAISAIGHVLRASPQVMPRMGPIPLVSDQVSYIEGHLEAIRAKQKARWYFRVLRLTQAVEWLDRRNPLNYLNSARFWLTALMWPYRTANNLLLAPLGDRFIGEQTRHAGAGIDVPGVYAAQVQTTPFGGPASNGLPASVDLRVIASSDTYAAALVPQLRRLLAESDGVAGFKTFFRDLKLKELVHNSYFDDDAVVRLIAHHINQHSGERAPPDVLDAECAEWYRSRKVGLEVVEVQGRAEDANASGA